MNQGYNKRLNHYLSEPKSGLRRASSEHSFIAAAKAKYLNNPMLATVANTSYYGSVPSGAMPCQECITRPYCNNSHL